MIWSMSQVVSSLFMTIFTIGIFFYWARNYRRRYLVKGKVVLVTGSCSRGGLGLNIAALAKTYNVKTIIVTSRKESDGLEALNFLDCIDGISNAVHFTLDLSWSDVEIEKAVRKLWETVGGIDVLICSAGVSYRGEILNTSDDVQRNIMQSNYFGNVSLIKCVTNLMKQRPTEDGYYIVGITSIQGKISIPFRSAYSASKHAFLAYLDCLRAEVAQYKIRVLNVAPSYIMTNLSKNAIRDTGDKHKKMDETTKNGMKPEQVAVSIYSSIRNGDSELLLLDYKSTLALYLRLLLPSAFFHIMAKRALVTKAY